MDRRNASSQSATFILKTIFQDTTLQHIQESPKPKHRLTQQKNVPQAAETFYSSLWSDDMGFFNSYCWSQNEMMFVTHFTTVNCLHIQCQFGSHANLLQGFWMQSSESFVGLTWLKSPCLNPARAQMCCSFSRFPLSKQQRLNPEEARGERREEDQLREESEVTRRSCDTNKQFNAQAREPLWFNPLLD